MSVTLSPRSLKQRGVEATSRLREIVGADDLQVLSTALAEVAVEKAERDSAFVTRIKQVYGDLISLKATRPLRNKRAKSEEVELVPIGSVEGYIHDPFSDLDPEYLYKVYGARQLRAALSRYLLASLKEASAKIEQQYPGTKPASRARKDAIIEYIVEQIAGPGY